MNSRTPITDVDHKTDIMDHVNQDHGEELLAMARSHCQQKDLLSAKILDIFEEGVQVNIRDTLEATATEIFIPFEIDGGLEDQILYLAYAAIVKEGRDLGGSKKHFFEIIGTSDITPNIVRLRVKSATPLPAYYPGYAYAFLLKSIKKSPSVVAGQKKHWGKNLFDRFFIWLMKHLSSKNRQKLIQSANKGVRLYTLRKSWKSDEDSAFYDRGEIDVFKHDETAGSRWASELNVGDVILSRSEATDKHPHLASGQTLLIADETAYPAIAGIVEHWQNPVPPYVILLSAAQEEQRYFEDSMFPQNSQVHRVICPAEKQAEEVLLLLQPMGTIDAVWAAFESESAKKVRHYLRNTRKIVGKNNHTKAYWKLTAKK